MNNGVVVYKLSMNKERLIVTYLDNEKKISSVKYSNMDSLHSESVSIKDDDAEIIILMNGEDLSEHKRLFHKVLGV